MAMPKLRARTAATGIVLVALVLAGIIAWWAPWDDEPTHSRDVVVGLYENAPKAYTDDEGRPAGLFPELLEEIAKNRGWHLRWVRCELSTCLDLLEQGELDLVPDVSFSVERDQRFDFHDVSVVKNWFQVYSAPNSETSSLADLEGKRVALLKGGLGQSGFRLLAEDAGVDFTEVEVATLDAGYQAVVDGEADAVVTNRFFAAYNSRNYDLTETPIIFLPTTVYFATTKMENADLLQVIDDSLTLWRADPNSVYFDILDHTLAGKLMEAEVSRWWMWTLFALVGAVLMIGLAALVLRHDVRLRTRALLTRTKALLATTEELVSERANLENQVEQRSTELTAAKEEAERLSNVKSDFLANMSHEIRTPMNAILGMLYLALKGDISPAARDQLLKAQSSTQNLLGIINDILDISKIESGRIELEHTEFGLEALMTQCADSVRTLADQKEIEFLIRYDPVVPAVLLGDPLRVGQILLNLCTNAIKFTEHGQVEVGVQCLEPVTDEVSLQFSVKDSGIGITAEQQAILFKSFTQADQSTTRRFGGSGLGLAISKSLVEMMGGRIWIEDSQPGRGTTVCFTVRLGVAKATAEYRRDLIERIGPMLEGTRVLVVDDNDNSRGILVELLRHLGLDAAPASNGNEALELVGTAHPPFDIIMLDWRMPGMNGDEVATRIRTDDSVEHQPKIVMTSSHGRENPLYLSEQARVDAFLVKPISPSTLLDTLLSVLGRERLLDLGSRAGGEPSEGAQNGTLAGAHMLLVEDNEINREFAATLLRGEGVRVHEAVNGREAVECVRQTDFDAVLMDIQMPDMDGIEAAQRIRALAGTPGGERFASLPIIAMTALAMAGDAERSRGAGMNDHVTKPLDPAHLIATLAKWVQVPEGGPTRALGAAPGGRPHIPPELLALTNVDPREGVRRIGGSADAYVRQMQRFRKHYGVSIDELRRTIVEQGLGPAAEYCHALKGVVGSLAAHRLYGTVSLIDACLRADQMPAATLLDHAAKELDSLVAEIDGLQSPDGSRPSGLGQLRATEIHSLVDRLKVALRYDFGKAAPVIDELGAEAAGTELEDLFAEFTGLVDIFDIEAAVELLSEMLHLPGETQG